ncbi:hypothetical protein [Bradyrhizobium sp. th.b2]|uniref:hypothetical protein n=1 Tax=Bradyrhizobium sp. th-b2 TaxID=172088 RepID=UPI00048DE55C|nr:hypothetical protein [Bradyrhizobium sp. th.b2]
MLAKSWAENTAAMGRDSIRYFVYSKGRWKWQPTKPMRAHGFFTVKMGLGGPGVDSKGYPTASTEDKMKAVELNAAWDAARLGLPAPQKRVEASPKYPPGSVGDGYQRAMAIRKAARLAKGIVWTNEQVKRDSWPRAWKWIEPKFADCDPRTITPEHFLRLDQATGKPAGLVVEIETKVSVTERFMVIKVWRALWKKMGGMKYCDLTADPAKTFPNTPPKPRDQVWYRKEVLKLVQVAWRNGYYGLAALMAVAWDSQLSPIDTRSLNFEKARLDNVGVYFALDRAKTGRAAAATLSAWSLAILRAYLAKQFSGAKLLDKTPLFWTRGGRPVSRNGETGQWGGDHGGGRHVPSRPYTKSSANQDFAEVRKLAFGPSEMRQLQDMRRSGAVEGDVGGATVEDQSNKMANTVDRNEKLRETYNPVNVVSARRFDQARIIGAKLLEEQKVAKSISATPQEILLGTDIPAKLLK